MPRIKKAYCLKKKGEYYYYKFPEMTTYKTTNLKSEAKAQKFVLDLIEQKNKENGIYTETNKTFGAYTKNYFVWGECPHQKRRKRERKELSQRYCHECYKTLDKKVRPVSWFMRKKMNEIRRRDILDLIDELCQSYSNGVVNDVITILRLIFNDAIFYEDIDRNPMSKIEKLSEEKKEKVVFTHEDFMRMYPIEDEAEIIRLYGSFSKFIFEFIECNTGMRNGEVRALRWKDIDFDNNIINIRQAFKDSSTKIIGTPKSRKTRITGLCDVLKKMLIKYRNKYATHTDPNDFVCCWDDGRPYRYETTRDTHEKVLKKLGIDHRGQHILRHTFNSKLRGKGYASDLAIRTTTGWGDEEIQGNYTHIEEEASKDIKKGQDKVWKDIQKVKLKKVG